MVTLLLLLQLFLLLLSSLLLLFARFARARRRFSSFQATRSMEGDNDAHSGTQVLTMSSRENCPSNAVLTAKGQLPQDVIRCVRVTDSRLCTHQRARRGSDAHPVPKRFPVVQQHYPGQNDAARQKNPSQYPHKAPTSRMLKAPTGCPCQSDP